jgi:hypothetical protein
MELIIESREVFVSLIINYVLAPLIKKLDDNYERALPCYKMTILLVGTNFFMRNLILAFLRISGNGRIYNAIKSVGVLNKARLGQMLKRHSDLYLKVKAFWDGQRIQAIL